MNLLSKRTALAFIILIGVVDLFGDMTYEGARSLTGQYLAILGASGTVVGIVAGLGEFIGYGIRLLSGYLTDKTGKYWTMTLAGYALNLLAVPLLALAGNWQIAAALIILERFGKAIRSPARDAMLSYAAKQTGRGWGFGLHEALDQTGAILGPLIVSCVLYFQGTYSFSFALLLIPALCALSVLTCAWKLYPRPQDLEAPAPDIEERSFTKAYWLYITAIACVGAGYVDFALIAFHMKKMALISDVWIPIFFAISMGAAGLSALFFGYLYDRMGFTVLIYVTAISSLFPLLVFINEYYAALAGLILWGVGLGAQESMMRAFVADIVHITKRGTAYGILNIAFGVCWFIGSAVMGFLYDISLPALILFSFGIQLAAIPLLIAVNKVK